MRFEVYQEPNEIADAFAVEPAELMDFLAFLSTHPDVPEDCAMAHSLSLQHMRIAPFLRGLADALDAVEAE